MMKNNISMFAVAACLFLAACNESKPGLEKLDVIPVGAAFDNLTKLKASDCFKQIRYVPLETTDSALVAMGASATILNDWIVVTSGRDRCQLFDKQTGRFIRSVAHVGEDPEGCLSLRNGWQNPNSDKLYFPGWSNKQVVYRADGGFDHIWTPPIKPNEFPAVTAFDYVDAETIVGYYSATDSLPARLAFFRGDEIVYQKPLLVDSKGVAAATPEEILSLSVLKDRSGGVIITKYKDNKFTISPMGNSSFWHKGKDLYFRQPYNDTIFQVTETMELQPIRLLDCGTHAWPYDERYEDKKDVIYPTTFMENDDVIFFCFMTNVFNEKSKSYNALYNKADGTVKVSSYDDKIEDDLNGFLPLDPKFITRDGEFVAILPAEDVVTWFEENGKTDLPASVEALKKVGEEDNPVVAIMK